MKLFILIALVGSASAALSTLQSEQVLAVHMQKTREVHKVFDSLIEVAHAQKRAASLGAKGFINQVSRGACSSRTASPPPTLR